MHIKLKSFCFLRQTIPLACKMQILLINQRMVCNVHLFDEKLSHCKVEINMTRKWFVFVLKIIHFGSKFCAFYTTRLYGFMETFILCCHDMTSLLISHTTFCRSVNLSYFHRPHGIRKAVHACLGNIPFRMQPQQYIQFFVW